MPEQQVLLDSGAASLLLFEKQRGWERCQGWGGEVLGVVDRRKPVKRKAAPTARARAKAVISSATEFNAPPKPRIIVPRAIKETPALTRAVT